MNTQHRMLVAPVCLIAGALMLSAAPAWSGVPDDAALLRDACRQGDRGRLIRFEQVASYPTPDDARAHFDEWIAFYQDFFHFPADLPETFEYGFDSYKVTYCTDDAVLPGQRFARTTTVTGMVAVPRKSGPLPTVAYVHGTSVSFYDAPSNPNIVGPLSSRGESFEGPPSSAVFAGNGFLYIAPDDLGLGDSRCHAIGTSTRRPKRPRRSICLRRRNPCWRRCTCGRMGGSSSSAGHRAGMRRWPSSASWSGCACEVTGTAVVGGVFDVERWFFTSLTSETLTRSAVRHVPSARVR